MDYKLYVEQYPNGNSCYMLFNDLKISKKDGKNDVRYTMCNDYNINIRRYLNILSDKYILVQYHYLIYIIYQLYPLSLSFPPISYLFILTQTQYLLQYPNRLDSKDVYTKISIETC